MVDGLFYLFQCFFNLFSPLPDSLNRDNRKEQAEGQKWGSVEAMSFAGSKWLVCIHLIRPVPHDDVVKQSRSKNLSMEWKLVECNDMRPTKQYCLLNIMYLPSY